MAALLPRAVEAAVAEAVAEVAADSATEDEEDHLEVEEGDLSRGMTVEAETEDGERHEEAEEALSEAQAEAGEIAEAVAEGDPGETR